MSTKEDELDVFCVSCGIQGGDDIKLKRCIACKLVHYCSVACQKEHRLQHKRACKKRAAELHDELLFKQPETSHLGECPLCLLPLPLDSRKSIHQACCSKLICGGCVLAKELHEEEESLEQKCPFCRTPAPKTDEEADRHLAKRVEANDPFALCEMGMHHYYDEQNYIKAVELCRKAAELGHVEAHLNLSCLYSRGQGVERDKKKELHHLEYAAIRGHPGARYDLGVYEGARGRMGRAVKHFIIGANLGHDKSMEELKELFKEELVSKEDLAAALRAHKAAVDATKSPQREASDEKIIFAPEVNVRFV